VRVAGASRYCLHLSGQVQVIAAGKPKLIASMMPTYIMGAEAAWASVPEDKRSGHLLNIEVDGGRKADQGAFGRSWIACSWATHRGTSAKTPFQNQRCHATFASEPWAVPGWWLYVSDTIGTTFSKPVDHKHHR